VFLNSSIYPEKYPENSHAYRCDESVCLDKPGRVFKILFFLHRHSQVRADMRDCIPVFLSIQQSMSAYATHGYARAGMISGFPDLFAGHVKRGTCSRDAGASGKSKDPNERLFSLYPNPARPRSRPMKFLGTRLDLNIQGARDPLFFPAHGCFSLIS
jgi:hypothetical protein